VTGFLLPPVVVGTGGAPWIGGGFEDTINEFLTYREALMMRPWGRETGKSPPEK
jgi:hypothetical protein